MSLFDFSEIISEVSVSTKNNIGIKNPLINQNNYLQIFVEKLNQKLNQKLNNDSRLSFEYTMEDNIFYLTLKIDKDKVLNILRGKIEIISENRKLSIFDSKKKYNIASFKDIVWMYCLDTECMNNIFKKGVEYFYETMNNYYIVVEKQISMYVYYLKNNIVLSDMFQIIFIYNFFLKKNIDEFIVNNFITFIGSFNIDNYMNDRNKYDKEKKEYQYYYAIVLKEIIEKINYNDNVKFFIEYDLFYYYYFFCISNYSFNEKYKNNIDISILKETFFKGIINYQIIEKDKIYERFSELKRGVIFSIPSNYIGKKKLKKEELEKNLKIFKESDEKNILIKSFVDSSVRTGNTNDIFNFLLDTLNLFSCFQTVNKNNNKQSLMNLYKKNRENIFETNFRQNIKIEQNNSNNYKKIGDFTGKININFTKNKVKVEYDFSLKKYYIYLCLEERKLLNDNGKYSDDVIQFICKIRKILNEYNYNIFYKLIDFLSKNNNNNKLIKFAELFANSFGKIKSDRINIALNALNNTILGKITENIKIESSTPSMSNSSTPSMNNSILIITYNEENKDYDFVDCIPILYKQFINPHAFIIVGTQESGTKKIKEEIFKTSEATHYPHVLGEYLGMIGYARALKESAHKLVKIKNLNVRMRIFYYVGNVFNGKNLPSNMNKMSKQIIEKNSNIDQFGNTYFQTFYKGAIFFKMIIKNKGIIQKFIFVNTHLYFNEKNNNEGYDQRKNKFLELLNKRVFTDKTNSIKLNLLELYENNYSIFLIGDLRFSINSLKEDLLKKNNPLLSSVNNEYITYVSENKSKEHTYDRILYALKNISPIHKELDKYLFPDKSKHSMISLSLSLENNVKIYDL